LRTREYKNKEWLEDQYINQKKTLRDIAKICEVSVSCIHYWIKKHNIPTRTIDEINNEKDWSGENNPNWNGGKRTSMGYVLIYKPEHPNRGKYPYIQEHRLVMEKLLGRYLTKEERVHHINYKKDDNRIENLYLCKTKSEHQKIKKILNSLIESLIDKGIIKFKNGEYYEG